MLCLYLLNKVGLLGDVLCVLRPLKTCMLGLDLGLKTKFWCGSWSWLKVWYSICDYEKLCDITLLKFFISVHRLFNKLFIGQNRILGLPSLHLVLKGCSFALGIMSPFWLLFWILEGLVSVRSLYFGSLSLFRP